jgi:hypothetical protein
MKDYIDFNTLLRQKSKNELEKNLFKLLNNIIYGKSLQRSDLLLDCELLNTEKKISKRLKSPLLKKIDIVIEDELVFVSSHKKKCKYNTALQIGFHILEKQTKNLFYALRPYNAFCREK